ncbi:phosphorylcholine phosphatase [Pseudomonas amygdali]|uniref:phosphorylcholine phosphatase n=1 Tax=Pseudomonas amygdali TaxID=47877 RepID=UPI0009BC10DC|nr:phosphorylcholine phosphatase [Pseudomonas amygdali]
MFRPFKKSLYFFAIGSIHFTVSATELSHWPAPAARQLDVLIGANAHSGAYAVFDMDNTTYRYDLEEALLPFLEMKGVLTRDNLDPSLKLIPFKNTNGQKKESLSSYYHRLCALDNMVCYPWAAQVYSGFTLAQLKGYVDEMMAYDRPITTFHYKADGNVEVGEVNVPRPYAGQQELYRKLMENGIEVYVVSAAHEELIRMVASDPQYGYGVKPENVIGVTTLLRDPGSGTLTTARKQIAEGRYDSDANLKLQVSPYLWTPATWYAGKPAAISTYINQWKKPILVAGDTPDSDGPMLFHAVDSAKGGVRLWINRNPQDRAQIDEMIKENAKAQAENRIAVTADKNWIVVTPDQIH